MEKEQKRTGDEETIKIAQEEKSKLDDKSARIKYREEQELEGNVK